MMHFQSNVGFRNLGLEIVWRRQGFSSSTKVETLIVSWLTSPTLITECCASSLPQLRVVCGRREHPSSFQMGDYELEVREQTTMEGRGVAEGLTDDESSSTTYVSHRMYKSMVSNA